MSSINQEFNLRPVWDAILSVYRSYSSLCKKHGLRHYCAYGTVLGAVRHKGFIPWDDDFDVMMPREDYNKFFAIADDELPEGLRTVTAYNDSRYPGWFGKVQVTDPQILRQVEGAIGLTLPHGLYIDVFPVDGVPSGWFYKTASKLLFFLVYAKSRRISVSKHPSWRTLVATTISFLTGWWLPPLCSNREIAVFEDRFLQKHKYETSRLCGCGSTFYKVWYPTRPFPREILGVAKWVPFENLTVPIPELYDRYLRFFYGDYMKLPPLEKRLNPYHSHLAVAPWRLGPDNIGRDGK